MARRRRQLRYRLEHGLCPTCGYDLRAQHAGDAGDKCPECGTALAGLRPQSQASPV